ncbi:hypothetical protein [Nocardia abscessus]|uniref:hypothetical protein n=1 Tax=Nocardia abscessus TaxID=120957 RepID=UPI0024561E96|nr:hypothetical protein [Nocardia abscessus]
MRVQRLILDHIQHLTEFGTPGPTRLLELRGLTVSYRTRTGLADAVRATRAV